MKYVSLGRTGLRVSRICLGTLTLSDPQSSRPIFERAIDLGVNFFDTAESYNRGLSEETLGAAVKERRDEVVICTKVFWGRGNPLSGGLSRHYVLATLKQQLKRLQTDYVDLYLIHRYHPSFSIDNVLRTMNHAIDQGSVHHIGASTMYAWEFAKSLWIADRLGLEPFQVMQNHYNLLYREEEREMLPLCKDQNVAVMCWSPLARGVLAGKYTRKKMAETLRAKWDKDLHHWFLRPDDFQIVDCVIELAKQKGIFPAQVALAWLLSKEEVTAPIIGATDVKHVEEAVEALDIKLTADDTRYLEEPYKPRELTGRYCGSPAAGDVHS